MASLLNSVPFDIWCQIASRLELEDYINLGLAHPQLRRVLRDDLISRKVAKSCIWPTAEANLATCGQLSYPEALERVYQVREAVATAEPYAAALIAYGESFVFNQGILCYLDGEMIRTLNVHRAEETETVVDIGLLFRNAMGLMSRPRDVEPQVSLLNYSDGIVACLCETQPHPGESWLMAIDVRPEVDSRRIRHLRQLYHTKNLFVRHNASYIYYGSHSGSGGTDCHREWRVHGVIMKENRDLTARAFQLRNLPGADIGSTICFEIKDDFFYAVSNQTGFRDEEIDWTSYYVCLRFPLADPRKIQWQRVWRRQHREGPINDTWTNISLQTDQSTGELMIVECRREWLNDASENQRTYYKHALIWGETSPQASGTPHPLHTATSASAAMVDAMPSPPETVTKANPGLPVYVPLSTFPDDPLIKLLDASSKPNYEPPKKRLRRHFHQEYAEVPPPSSVRKDFIHSKTKYSTYHHSASAFVDLVNDPPPQSKFFSTPPDRLRLRVNSRKRKSPIDEEGAETAKGLLYPPEYVDEDGNPTALSDERFEPRGIRLWPPNDAPAELLALLCPSGHAGRVEAASDERCLIYSTQPEGSQGRRPIILISFDPSIRPRTLQRLTPPANGEAGWDMDNKNNRRQQPEPIVIDLVGSPSASGEEEEANTSPRPTRRANPAWFSKQQAMYLDINRGFWLR